MEAGDFAAGAYFSILVALVIFIVFSLISVLYLIKELKKSQRREEEISVYSRAILLAQENERMRISRELHDTIAQDLRYLSLSMNKIARTEDYTEREKLCADASELQSGLINKVRSICENIVPPDFYISGLPDALRILCRDFGEKTGLDCRFDIDMGGNEKLVLPEGNPNGTALVPEDEKLLQIYRIVQEALTNIDKHARASEALVMLRRDTDGSIFIGVSDDGKGFEPKEKVLPLTQNNNKKQFMSGTHLGIRGMTERAALLGGSVEIKSEKGEGTLVKLILNKNSRGSV